MDSKDFCLADISDYLQKSVCGGYRILAYFPGINSRVAE